MQVKSNHSYGILAMATSSAKTQTANKSKGIDDLFLQLKGSMRPTRLLVRKSYCTEQPLSGVYTKYCPTNCNEIKIRQPEKIRNRFY